MTKTPKKHWRPSERFTPKVDICSTYVVITLFLQIECTRHVPYPGGFWKSISKISQEPEAIDPSILYIKINQNQRLIIPSIVSFADSVVFKVKSTKNPSASFFCPTVCVCMYIHTYVRPSLFLHMNKRLFNTFSDTVSEDSENVPGDTEKWPFSRFEKKNRLFSRPRGQQKGFKYSHNFEFRNL